MRRYVCALFLLGFFCSVWASTSENSSLLINSGAKVLMQYTKSALLQRKDVENIAVAGNPAFHEQMHTYQAIKLCHLLAEAQQALNNQFPGHAELNNEIIFVGADGFSTSIPTQKLVNCQANKAVAYLAIEPASKWPPLPHGQGSAGPFDLIWQATQQDKVSAQYWPWQVAQIKVQASPNANNQVLPPKTQDQAILAGYKLYMGNCSVCHTVNKVGLSHMGPDLNMPKNPVEYFKNDELLQQFIRHPQSIRYLENDKMPGVGTTLSKQEMANLIAYLHFLAKEHGGH